MAGLKSTMFGVEVMVRAGLLFILGFMTLSTGDIHIFVEMIKRKDFVYHIKAFGLHPVHDIEVLISGRKMMW